MDNHNKILEEYVLYRTLFTGFKDKTTSLLKDLFYVENLNPHQITCRVKTKESLKNKLLRKNDKYNSIYEITDIVGIRIITYFEDDVDKIAKIIEQEFNIDIDNSIDKRILDDDRFGYKSLHYIVSLNNDRLQFTENKIYKEVKAEIQVRSILQHAWAEIEHDIGYKGEFEIPRFARRRFYRIAALLETADIEFVKLKDSLKKYEEGLSKDIEKSPEEVLLDKASLGKYISDSPTVEQIDLKLAEPFKIIEFIDGTVDLNLYLKRLKFFNITTVKELDSLLKENEVLIINFFLEFIPPSPKSTQIIKGICVFYLAYVLATKDEDLNLAESFCKEVFTFTETQQKFPKQLISTYKKIKDKK